MRISICTKLFVFFSISALFNNTVVDAISKKPLKTYTQNEIDNSWIQVPWSHGGYYYHNTITREDRDHPPTYKYKKPEL